MNLNKVILNQINIPQKITQNNPLFLFQLLQKVLYKLINHQDIIITN